MPFFCDYGYNIPIGDNSIIGPDCQLLNSGRIAVGRNTKIGARVTISTLRVPTDKRSLKGSEGIETAREVYIGENVYIGDGCIIEAGVRVGNNATVRAESVVIQASTHLSSFSANLR
jgi:acetyltransferase-like isoleucine patch superfamily enzyme